MSETEERLKRIEAIGLAQGCFADAIKELGTFTYYELKGYNALQIDVIARFHQNISDGLNILAENGIIQKNSCNKTVTKEKEP